MTEILQFISDYGYAALFLLLALGIVGIPIPDETLMIAVGGLTAGETLTFANVLIVCFCGSMTGMMLSYWLGRKVGSRLLHRYGKWIHLTPERIAKTEKWFKKYGGFSITFGYFIPGVRHVTCYLAGVTRVPFARYLCFASIGALLWCTLFISLGRFVGDNWDVIRRFMKHNLGNTVSIIVLVVLIIFFLILNHKKAA